MLLMTDLGHDPDDAVALSYLIEHNWVPDSIILSPGFPTQVEIAHGICRLYDVHPNLFTAKEELNDGGYNPGKHKVFTGKTRPSTPITHPKLNYFVENHALIIGPAKNLGGKLKCGSMVFQGGYSPNSINKLEKFENINAVQSFNPCGSKKDFNILLESPEIYSKMYVGKNVCHGYTKSVLSQEWEPNNKTVKKFCDQLSDKKAMHDVLAAKCLINPLTFRWEQAKPKWCGNKLTTEPTQELIWSLIGL